MLDGELIYQTSDEYGSIEVIDYMQQIRALQFGNGTQQSACLLCNPAFLTLNYAQVMTLPLCWVKPKRILILGLGAGSMVNFFLKAFPNVTIDSVELRSKVFDVATQYFDCPKQHERLNVFVTSAENWLDIPNKHQYDMIFVDVFLTSKEGKDTTVNLQSFHSNLYNLLTIKGVVSINYLNKGKTDSYPGLKHLTTLFEQQIYSINVENINSIIFASKTSFPQIIENERFSQMKKVTSVSYQKYFNILRDITF